VAALEVFADEPVALIAGGFDRGVEYGELAEALVSRDQPTTLITSGNAGLRISDEVRGRDKDLVQHTAPTMLEAVELARAALPKGGVVLLSPAAPSFDRYHNWEERSDDFTHIVRSLLS
jgi:UDP-N-acetylmuramoyl-L-alanine---L-glutamate ligase